MPPRTTASPSRKPRKPSAAPRVKRTHAEVLELLRPTSVYGQVIQHAADCAPFPVSADEFREVVGPSAGSVLTMGVKRGNLEHVGRSLYRYRPEGPHAGDARVLELAPKATSVSNLAIQARVGVARCKRILELAGIDPAAMPNANQAPRAR